MTGVRFGTKHSYSDWGLILAGKSVGYPEPKTQEVDNPAKDGVDDLTESIGTVKFGTRTLSFTFNMIGEKAEWNNRMLSIANYIHGAKLPVVLDEDDDYYYFGKVTINEFQTVPGKGTVVINVVAEPYKYELSSRGASWLWDSFSLEDGVIKIYEYNVNGSLSINLQGGKKVVCPTISTTENLTIIHNNVTYHMIAGATKKMLDIELKEGDNYIVLQTETNAVVNIDYESGWL